MKVLAVLCALMVAAHAQEQGNLVERLGELGLTTLVDYIEFGGLTEVLEGLGPLTIFAPTNEAFAALPDEIRLLMESDPEVMATVLLTHTVAANVTSGDLFNELLVETVAGASIRINIYDNGAITATGKPIQAADDLASNGVIHTLSGAIFPFPIGTLNDIIANDPSFTFLSTLVAAAGLDDVLSSDLPMTLFAPDDAAFDKLDDDVIDAILGNPELLYDILLYHVTVGTEYAKGLENGFYATVQGGFVEVGISQEGKVTVDDAAVTDFDFPATNGVLHTIDEVLIPSLRNKDQ